MFLQKKNSFKTFLSTRKKMKENENRVLEKKKMVHQKQITAETTDPLIPTQLLLSQDVAPQQFADFFHFFYFPARLHTWQICVGLKLQIISSVIPNEKLA